MKELVAKISVVALLILVSAATTLAAIRPRFMSRDVGWHSSDIVEVIETGELGKFKVIDTWKGSLRVGDVVQIPTMVEWQGDANRRSYDDDFPNPHSSVLSTRRLLLFMKREGPVLSSTRQVFWSPATFWERWQPSFVWLQGEEMYGYRQGGPVTAGDSTLHDLEMTKDKLRDEVMKFASERDEFNNAVFMDDLSARASSLLKFLGSQNPLARSAAEKALEKIGPTASSSLIFALHNSSWLPEHGEVARILAKVGNKDAGPPLIAYLNEDAKFWSAEAPRLKPAWWNDMTDYAQTEVYRNHYSADAGVIEGLLHIKYIPGADIEHFCHSWSRVPRLDVDQTQDELLQKCNLLRQAIAKPPSN